MKKVLDLLKQNIKIVIAVVIVVILIIVALAFNYSSNKTQVNDGKKTQTEEKLETILSNIDGVGATDVMIHESDGMISGVVIVCSGGDNIMVRNNILNAVATALNIDKNNIAIYAMSV